MKKNKWKEKFYEFKVPRKGLIDMPMNTMITSPLSSSSNTSSSRNSIVVYGEENEMWE